MATNVNVTKVYANPDHFQGKNTPQYVYSINSGNTSPGIQWSGNTLNGVGTYLAPGFIKANEKLLFDGFALSAGTFTGPYGTSTFSASVGSDQAGENGRLELIGNQTTFASVGGISIHNEASAHATKTIFDLTVSRWTDDDEAILAMSIGDTGANLNQFYVVTSAQQQWKVGLTAKMNLETDTLRPEGGQTVDLGAGATPWSTIYVNNIVVPTLAGTGNRLTYMDAGGVFGDIDWLTYSSTSILEIGTGQSSASLALEYGDTNPYELSANTTDGMYIHQYSSKIMHFTTSLITAVVDVRLDALAGTGERIVVADVDGDLSATTTIADIVSFGSSSELPYTNGTGDGFSYDPNFTYNGSTMSAPALRTDAITEVTAAAGVTIEGGLVKDNSLGGTSNYWDYVYVDYAIFKHATGTNPSAIYTTASDQLVLSAGGTSNIVYSSDVQPNSSGTRDIGTTSLFFNGIYGTSFYIDDTATNIEKDSAGNMVFTDAISGPQTLADLIGGGGSMVYPGAGIALSTGTAWDTSITDNSATWNAAQPGHVNLTSLSGLTYVSSAFVKMTAAGTFTLDTTTYSEQTLSLGTANQIPHMTGTTDFTYTTDFTFDGTDFKVPGGIFAAALTEGTDGDYVVTWDSATGEFIYDNDILITGAPSGIRFASAASTLSWVGTGTEIWLDGTNNLTFKDAVAGTIILDDLSTQTLTLGSAGLIPHMDGSTDFQYDAKFYFSSPFLHVGTGDTYITLDAQGGISMFAEGNGLSSSSIFYATAALGKTNEVKRKGGSIGSVAAAPTDAYILDDYYYAHDGTTDRVGARYRVKVDGAMASNNFDTEMEWHIRDGAAAAAKAMGLDTTGLSVTNDLTVGSGILAQNLTVSTAGDYLLTWDVITGEMMIDSGLLATADGIRMSTAAARLAFGTGASYIDESGGELRFTDATSSSVLLSDLVGGSSPWQVNSNLITTTTALDDIQLVAGEQLRFGSSSNRIEYIATNKIRVTTAGTSCVDFDSGGNLTVYNAILPDTNGSNIGTTGLFWGAVNADAYNIEDGTTTIDQDASTNMVLTDAVSGAHTLSELASGHKIVRIQHSDDGVTIDIADLGLGDVAWSDISIMMYVVTAFNSSAPQLHIGNTAHTSTYYLAAGNPGWSTTGFKTFSLSNDPNFISGNETINCQYNDSSADGSTGDCYLYFSYISA